MGDENDKMQPAGGRLLARAGPSETIIFLCKAKKNANESRHKFYAGKATPTGVAFFGAKGWVMRMIKCNLPVAGCSRGLDRKNPNYGDNKLIFACIRNDSSFFV